MGSKLKHSGRRLLGGILENLQSLRLYRVLIKRLIRINVTYQMASSDDAYSLSLLYGYNQQSPLENPTDALTEQLEDPGDSEYCFVAKNKDKVIGSVTLAKLPENDSPYAGWWIFSMKVHWRYRRMGIGKKLTKMAADVAVKNGASDIKLFVLEDAKPANGLYQKAGFHKISIPELDEQLEEEAKNSSRLHIILTKPVYS
jgi:ribosomal protein S18 acetylase RimI-like enzyme